MSVITDKARKASFSAMNKCSSIGKVSVKTGLHIFDSFVKPVLTYGSEIWSLGKEIDEIETVQLRFLKMLLNVKESTANVAMYAETGRYPIYIQYRINVIKYVGRLIKMHDDNIVRKAYLELYKLHNLNLRKDI